jgi:hypothetical protein
LSFFAFFFFFACVIFATRACVPLLPPCVTG